MRLFVLLFAVLAATFSPLVLAADIPGAKDPPMLSRMPGYDIADYDAQDFSAFEFSTDPAKKVEGRYWRVQYQVREGARKAGPLQIARNYTNAVVAKGGKKLREDVDASGGTTIAELPSPSGAVWVQLEISNEGDFYDFIVVQEAAMEQKVEFDASELAAALKANGFVALHSVLFDTGKATLQPQSAQALAPVAELMKGDAALKLEIQGHTDNAGAPAANLKLSTERAAAVRAYLVQTLGVPAARLTSAGFGDTKPVADNRTEAGRAQNRRVELVRK